MHLKRPPAQTLWPRIANHQRAFEGPSLLQFSKCSNTNIASKTWDNNVGKVHVFFVSSTRTLEASWCMTSANLGAVLGIQVEPLLKNACKVQPGMTELHIIIAVMTLWNADWQVTTWEPELYRSASRSIGMRNTYHRPKEWWLYPTRMFYHGGPIILFKLRNPYFVQNE